METITGFVEHIVYRNEENGYTVLNLASNEEDEVTCVGVFQMISEGESLEWGIYGTSFLWSAVQSAAIQYQSTGGYCFD